MTANELRNELRRSLKATLADLDSDAFLDSLEQATEADRAAAAITRGEVYRAWRRLNNLELDEIRNQLRELEAELLRAAQELSGARAKLDEVAGYLEAANSFLALVKRVISPV
ncbi:MAG: hypothetical protein ACK58M_17170 [Acidobacteriota bacterium]|jgi:hypothetical protein|nr:hypothetical protein [Bryobacteraceae bacterium CoA2 C42]MCA2965867.1 hypothetical protein [Acidobacteriaceae bacterium]